MAYGRVRGSSNGAEKEDTAAGSHAPRKLKPWMAGVTAHHRGRPGKLKVYPGIPRATGPEGYFGSKEPRRSCKKLAKRRPDKRVPDDAGLLVGGRGGADDDKKKLAFARTVAAAGAVLLLLIMAAALLWAFPPPNAT